MKSGSGSEPIDIVRELYDCFERNDLQGALALAAPDCVLSQDPALPWGGSYRGHEGAAEFFIALVGSIESKLTPLALFQAGPHVVQYGTTSGTARETGKAFTIPECHVWRVERGEVVEGTMFIDSAAMNDALST